MKMGKGRRRVIEMNGVRISKLSEMIGAFRAVLFCPEHLSLVKEGPSMRRSYLDVAISQFRPVYLRSLQRYYAVLEQRNKLIKGAEEDRHLFDSTVDLWSAQLAHEAAIIASYRERYVKTVHRAVSDIIKEMSGEKEEIEISYAGSAKLEEYSDISANEERFLHLLTSHHDREIGAGSTLWGIHKDDIDIKINGKEARRFASQGQQRSIALAMKLAEGDICKVETGDFPVLLLDDVLSELDGKRREYLLSSVAGRQVIMTTCEDGDFGDVNKITVENGRYIQNL
jgi:DNA replication and repair protein RecF